MKQQTIVFKVSENLKKKMIEFYKDRFEEKHPPYSVFQVKEYDCVITLYESGKVMFQGLGADIEASIWTEEERINNDRDVNAEIDDAKKKKEEKEKDLKDDRFKNVSTIGSDEVGTGDYFGPLVVTASYVDKSKISRLYELGVRDSKKINDSKIREIGPVLMKEYPHVTYILNNSTYNKWGITNMNQVKAILHNRVLTELKKKANFPYKYTVVDQFCFPAMYFKHIAAAKEVERDITFTTHAEDKCLSVAVSSIISRYIFLNEMDKMSKELGMNIPLGAGSTVDKVAASIVKKFGQDKLRETTKLNFKNTEKLKEFL